MILPGFSRSVSSVAAFLGLLSCTFEILDQAMLLGVQKLINGRRLRSRQGSQKRCQARRLAGAAEEMDMAAAIIREDDRFDYGETRYIAFGDIDDALYCFVFTFRGSKVRTISLRKASKRESRRYGRQTKI
jgi:uncharacterized DUF497 family protein